MAFIVIIISIAVQYYLKFGSYHYRLNWIEPYYRWMVQRIEIITKGHFVLAYIILILPLLLIVSIVFALTYHLLGIIGYFILNLVFVWYCLDARDLKKEPYQNIKPTDLFILTYQNLFAVIFWYALFGPFGLAIYLFVTELRIYLHESNKHKKLRETSLLVQGIIDWVPLRLLGLSFALVGHFAVVFKVLMKDLFSGISLDRKLLMTWGKAALQLTASQKKSPSIFTDEIIGLIHRALLVWLVVLALLSIAFWLG